jgi:hypothetical protein
MNGNLDEILCGGDAMVGNFDATTFNPIALTILKWLRFKVVMWMHHSALLNSGLGLINIVGYLRFHHIPSSDDEIMETSTMCLDDL